MKLFVNVFDPSLGIATCFFSESPEAGVNPPQFFGETLTNLVTWSSGKVGEVWSLVTNGGRGENGGGLSVLSATLLTDFRQLLGLIRRRAKEVTRDICEQLFVVSVKWNYIYIFLILFIYLLLFFIFFTFYLVIWSKLYDGDEWW